MITPDTTNRTPAEQPPLPDTSSSSGTVTRRFPQILPVGERIVWLIFGLGLALFGIRVAGNAIGIHHRAIALQDVPVVTSVVLADSPPGRSVFIEGSISSSNEVTNGFVAYEYQERERVRVWDDDDDEYEWEERWSSWQAYAPALQIETSSGVVASFRGYDISDAPHTYQSGDRRWAGFEAGDTVALLGTVAQDDQGEAALNTSVLHGGTKATYLSSQHNSAWFNLLSGSGMIVVAVVLLARAIMGVDFIEWIRFVLAQRRNAAG